MKPKGQSIRRQILVFSLLLCAGVMLPVGCGLFFHNYRQTRARLHDSLQASAGITAANVSAALAFGDQDSAREILSALRNDPLITSAVIRDSRGGSFASFDSAKTGDTASSPHLVSVQITHSGETYGELVVTGDTARELRSTAFTWVAIYLAAFGLSVVSALLIARRFQRTVSTPLVNLAATAVRVAHERDYQTRATVAGCAEAIDLAVALNVMLAEIGRRDQRLALQVESLNREIRERENAESALRDNQHDMVRLSREAGMAEVAAGVLHNIGNVLTSINVSSDLIAARVTGAQHRPVATLRKLLGATAPKTAVVFSVHPDGTELRALLSSLAENTATDLDEVSRLLEMMRKGISHLKRIVSSQQSLARTSSITESIQLRDVLQDSLVLARTIARQFSPLTDNLDEGATIHADRSLAVQILLNLLLNAHESIVARAPASPMISISFSPATDGFTAVSVQDNGVGIPPDKLVTIFTYGYTTKLAGHGFGLHNSANAARLMGGSLAVISPGSGLGATFTLTLPSRPPSGQNT